MTGTETLQATLFAEMRARIKEEDVQVPVRDDAFFYYTRMVEGQQYPVHCRRRLRTPAVLHTAATSMSDSVCEREEVLWNENEAAKSSSFYRIGGLEPSPSHRHLAFSEDRAGGEKYTIRIAKLPPHKPPEFLPDTLPDCLHTIAWASDDDQTLFYCTKDIALDRPDKVWRHTVGTHKSQDTLVFHEPNDAFSVSLSRSPMGDLILISSDSPETSETMWLDARVPASRLHSLGRTKGVEYKATFRDGIFWVITNADKASNAKLLAVPMDRTTGEVQPPTEVLPHRANVRLESVAAAPHHLAISQRIDGLPSVLVHAMAPDGPAKLGPGIPVPMAEAAYSLDAEASSYPTDVLRYHYSSLTTPWSTYDVDMGIITAPGTPVTPVLKKRQPVLGNFDPANYKYVPIHVTGFGADVVFDLLSYGGSPPTHAHSVCQGA